MMALLLAASVANATISYEASSSAHTAALEYFRAAEALRLFEHDLFDSEIIRAGSNHDIGPFSERTASEYRISLNACSAAYSELIGGQRGEALTRLSRQLQASSDRNAQHLRIVDTLNLEAWRTLWRAAVFELTEIELRFIREISAIARDVRLVYSEDLFPENLKITADVRNATESCQELDAAVGAAGSHREIGRRRLRFCWTNFRRIYLTMRCAGLVYSSEGRLSEMSSAHPAIAANYALVREQLHTLETPEELSDALNTARLSISRFFAGLIASANVDSLWDQLPRFLEDRDASLELEGMAITSGYDLTAVDQERLTSLWRGQFDVIGQCFAQIDIRKTLKRPLVEIRTAVAQLDNGSRSLAETMSLVNTLSLDLSNAIAALFRPILDVIFPPDLRRWLPTLSYFTVVDLESSLRTLAAKDAYLASKTNGVRDRSLKHLAGLQLSYHRRNNIVKRALLSLFMVQWRSLRTTEEAQWISRPEMVDLISLLDEVHDRAADLSRQMRVDPGISENIDARAFGGELSRQQLDLIGRILTLRS